MDRLTGRLAFVLTAMAMASCAGNGTGVITGSVDVPACGMSGAYELHPSFYGGERFGNSLAVRIQNQGGSEDYTDNLVVTIDDASVVARALESSSSRDDQGFVTATFPVGLSQGDGSIVHAIFTPTHSCGRNKVTNFGQTIGLSARTGTITFRAIDRGESGAATAVQPVPRRTDVSAFHFVLTDPRPFGLPAPTGVDPDGPSGSADFSGSFRFDYTRGAPEQLFP